IELDRAPRNFIYHLQREDAHFTNVIPAGRTLGRRARRVRGSGDVSTGQIHAVGAERGRFRRVQRLRGLADRCGQRDRRDDRGDLGNPVMIEAYRAGTPGNGKPFPDGAKMAKIHWKAVKSAEAPSPTVVPGDLHDIDFMVRDSKRFADTGNWGYAQFDYETGSG